RFGKNPAAKQYLPALSSGKIRSAAAFSENMEAKGFSGINSFAKTENKKLVINGTKTCVANGKSAAFYVVLCRTGQEQDGSEKNLSLICIPSESAGISVTPSGPTIGASLIDFADVKFENVRVPEQNILGKPDCGLSHRLDFMDEARIQIASMALGLAQGAFDRATGYVKQRKQFGRKLASFQAIRHKLAEMYAEITAEEMAKTNHAGLAASLHSDVVVPYIESFGTESQKKKYLPGCVSGDIITAVAMTEPDAGSDLAGMTTSAEKKDGQIILNGSKTFISNGINADLVIVAAKDAGISDPYKAVSLFLVEDGTPGFKRGRKLEKMGFHSQDTAELFFTNCCIPAENRLGEKGSGFYMLMEKLQQERLMAAICAQAGAELMLELTVDFCKQTKNHTGKPLSKQQAVQFAIVEMSTEVKLGRTFLEKLIAGHWQGENVVVETSMAKYWITDLAKRISQRCIQLFGDYGFLESCPVARGFRDVRVMPIFAGTNEIMRNIAAKFMGL
ncbi:MAG: acyl-CoA dehydrogenase family protein, partial [Desulfobacterales bacterium]